MADFPKWAAELSESVLDCIEGFTFFETRYSSPSENEYESHLIEIAPAKFEIAEAGEHDGEEIFDSNFDVDLLGLKSAFSTVRYFHSGIDYETLARTFSVEASYRGRRVSLTIRTIPFEGAEIVGRVRQGGVFEFFEDVDDGEI